MSLPVMEQITESVVAPTETVNNRPSSKASIALGSVILGIKIIPGLPASV